MCAGPFTLGTAARLLGVDELVAAECLDELVGKSLIVVVRFSGGSQGYHFLETLRDYGRAPSPRQGVGRRREALEHALLPSAEVPDDWIAFVNEYICATTWTSSSRTSLVASPPPCALARRGGSTAAGFDLQLVHLS